MIYADVASREISRVNSAKNQTICSIVNLRHSLIFSFCGARNLIEIGTKGKEMRTGLDLFIHNLFFFVDVHVS